MPGILPLHLILLLASPPDVDRVPPGITPELPDGAAATFRPIPADPEQKAKVAAPVAPRVERARAVLPRLSSRFGRRGDPLRGTMAVHHGIDIPGALGTPVLAAASGRVRFAGSAGSYGGMIEIAHDGAIGTRYAHLSRILVRPGARVEQGQPVALMGSTGRSTGSHLHFEVRVGGSAVDPLPWLAGVESLSSPRPVIVSEPPHVSAFSRARAAAGPEGRAL